MSKLFFKIFIKEYENYADATVRENYGKLAGVVGIVSNIILCVMKMLIGIISGSIAIIADAVNNLTDASSSVITLVGFKLASMPEDEEHPYGHARIEYLTGLLVSIIIIIVGIELLTSSIDKIMHPVTPEFSIATILVLVLAILIKVWQALFNFSVGKKINSLTLIATGTDSRNDVISTTVVLVSLLITHFTNINLDGYVGCLVALFIIWSGIQLVRETSSPLLGEAPDPELVKSIEVKTLSYNGVLGIHDLVVHNYGPGRIFASIHIEVDANGDIMESHDMIDNIERELSEELRIHLVAHLDPIQTDDPILNQVREKVGELLEEIEGVVSFHDFRMVSGPSHTNIIFDIVLSHNCTLKEAAITEKVQNFVRTIDENYFVVITFDRVFSKMTD